MDIYYKFQYSLRGEEDWYNDGRTFDSPESAFRIINQYRHPGFDYRVVKVTTSEEVISQ